MKKINSFLADHLFKMYENSIECREIFGELGINHYLGKKFVKKKVYKIPIKNYLFNFVLLFRL